MSNLILGIDDAGRGPVIGPMILAGCLIKEGIQDELKKLGVRDSKQLTPKRREFLESVIKEKAEAFCVKVSHPEEIDNTLSSGTNLNALEAKMAASIINEINKSSKVDGAKMRVVLDCPSTNRTAWRETLILQVENLSNLEIVCEHKADVNHVSVSAASILAKQERERQMDTLKEKYGPSIGSGYPSDPKTKMFLETNKKKLEHKGVFRKSWDTWKKAKQGQAQKKLF